MSNRHAFLLRLLFGSFFIGIALLMFEVPCNDYWQSKGSRCWLGIFPWYVDVFYKILVGLVGVMIILFPLFKRNK